MNSNDSSLPQEQKYLINEYIEERLEKLFKTIGVSSVVSLLLGIAYLFFYVPHFATNDIETQVTREVLGTGSKLDDMRSDLLQKLGSTEQFAVQVEEGLQSVQSDLEEQERVFKASEIALNTRLEISLKKSSSRIEALISDVELRVENVVSNGEAQMKNAAIDIETSIDNGNTLLNSLEEEISSIETQLAEQRNLLISITDDEISSLARLARDMKGNESTQDILDRVAILEERQKLFALSSEVDTLIDVIDQRQNYVAIYKVREHQKTLSDHDLMRICINKSINRNTAIGSLLKLYSINLHPVDSTNRFNQFGMYKSNQCSVYLDYASNALELSELAATGKHALEYIRF